MRRTFDRFRASESHPLPGPDCLDELALAAAIDGRASAGTIEHLSSCAACRARVAHLGRLLADAPVQAEIRRLDAGWRTGWASGKRLIGLAAAAAVVLLAVIPALPRAPDAGDGFRDEAPVAPAAAPVLLAPDLAGESAGLRWSAVPAASQYRLTIFDAEGALIWSVETSDTTATIPATVSLAPATQYWWRVEARVDFDRWNPSRLGSFVSPQRE
jgi:hypothetical protein